MVEPVSLCRHPKCTPGTHSAGSLWFVIATLGEPFQFQTGDAQLSVERNPKGLILPPRRSPCLRVYGENPLQMNIAPVCQVEYVLITCLFWSKIEVAFYEPLPAPLYESASLNQKCRE